ncbi:MAG: secretin and TonB N-terminal domain-containing protein, partial [Odoribacteraceae bacterium]|nr:secretin and TonB N-terminal domain-containing protein [Odoribacteraceae bacterium]
MKKNQDSTSPGRGKWNKILLIMKLKIMLVVISCLPMSATAYSQNSKVSMHVENASLEEIIWDLQKKTDFVFMYGTREIDHVRGLNVDVQDKTVQEILTLCLKGTGLSSSLSGNTVIIRRELVPQEPRLVRGTVKDEKGIPLPGVSVQVKGTLTGSSSDVKGEFVISV